MGNTSIAPRSPYPQGHGIIHRYLTAWRGLDSSQDKAWLRPPDTEKQQHCPAPPGPEELFTAQASTQRLTPTCRLGPAPQSPLPAVSLPSRLGPGPGSWQSPLLVLHTTCLVSSHPPITMYLISKRKQTHNIQPQKEGNSDTHHDMNETFFPFCTVKSFADYFLICLQALTWMNLEDNMLMKSAGHKRTHTTRVHLHEAPKVIKVLETGSRMAVSGARGMKERGIGV